jgi:hypothetical protein
MVSTVGRCINLLECSIKAIWKWHQIVGMSINMSSFGSLCLVVVKISLVPFFCGKIGQNLLMERKYVSTVGRCINLLECCITAIEKWHQQLECASIVGMETKMASTLGRCIKCWNWLKFTSTVGMWHQLVGMATEKYQQLECASIVGMWHQHLEGASNVGMET